MTRRRGGLAHDIKPIIHIDGGLHASEVANAQHTIQLGYDLVAREEPEYKAIRENLIVELWFSINPDGQNMVAELVSAESWARRTKSARCRICGRNTWATTTIATATCST